MMYNTAESEYKESTKWYACKIKTTYEWAMKGIRAEREQALHKANE